MGELTRMDGELKGAAESLEKERKFRDKLLAEVVSSKTGWEKVRRRLVDDEAALARQVGALPGGFSAPRRFEDSKGALAPPVALPFDRGFGEYIDPRNGQK